MYKNILFVTTLQIVQKSQYFTNLNFKCKSQLFNCIILLYISYNHTLSISFYVT